MILKILEMSLMGSVVILVTILMRLFLKKSSKKYVMILWAIVALRLLVPVSFESALSVFNYIPHKVTSIKEVSAPAPAVKAPEVKKTDVKPVAKTEAPATKVDEVVKTEPKTSTKTEVSKVNKAESFIAKEAEAAAPKTSKVIDLKSVLGIVYGVGVVGIVGYCAISYVMLRRRIKDATEIEKNVYESEKVNSPFVLGFITPKIYLPDVLEKDEREYILLHERTHIRHGDWISKLIGMAVVAVHWFNPIVWIGYALFEQDIEMLCDEDTVATMDNELKKAYTMSIVTYAKKSSGKVYLVAPLSFSKPNFGKREVTNRVKNIINYRKGTKITAILTTIVVFGVSTACAFNSTSESKDETKASAADETTIETTAETTESVVDDSDDAKPVKFQGVPYIEEDHMEDRRDHVGATFFYNLLMDKAAELHSEDEDDSLIYGFVDVNLFNYFEYRMFVYDTATDEYTTYCYDSEKNCVEEFDYIPFESYEDMNNTEADKWLMPYDDFVAFPGATTYNLFRLSGDGYDRDIYHSVMEDGRYQGRMYAVSEDFSNVVVEIAPLPDCDYVVDNLENLNIGDEVDINGQKVTIGDYSKNDDIGLVYVGLDDGEYSNIYKETLADGDAVLVNVHLLGEYQKKTLVQLPLAEDAVLNVYNETKDEFVTLDRDTFKDYFMSVDEDSWDSGYGIFDGTGIAFQHCSPIEYYNHPLVIKDGKITEMTISIKPLS